VERFWHQDESRLKEFLKVSKNGDILEEVDSEHWGSFIAGIVPERLSQLFFFDGEKIQSIAEDVSSNQAIASSIRSLLGLDLVERLSADLGVFLAKSEKITKAKEEQQLLKETTTEKEKIDAQINAVNDRDLPAARTKIIGLQNEIAKVEAELRETGWSFANERDKNLAEEGLLEERISTIERDLRLECEREFAFALCPELSGRLMERLQQDEITKRKLSIREETKFLEKNLRTKLQKDKELDPKAVDRVSKVLAEFFLHYQKSNDAEDEIVVHQVSPKAQQRIERIIAEVAPRSTKRVENLGSKYESSFYKLQKVKALLQKVPDQAMIQPTIAELSQLNLELGRAQEQKAEMDTRCVELKFFRNELKRKIESLGSSITDKEKGNEKVEYVGRLRPALKEYETRVTKLKLAAMERAVAECFDRIVRKPDFATRVSVDPETFETTLFDDSGNTIPRSDLSSGEKQIFAISMLWGLAKTSGRPLPVVIDTPLGRLDSEHRKNLVNHYFPEAAHQVIMLSTDTEVEKELYEDLEPHLSHCYHLIYNSKTGATTAEPNYFWK
jgi:DNA sulfur modification protein DndD